MNNYSREHWVDLLLLHLSGDAADLAYNFLDSSQTEGPMNYDELVAELEAAYQKDTTPSLYRQKFYAKYWRKQDPDEDVDIYISEMRRLAAKAWPECTRAHWEREIREHLIAGLPKPLHDAVMLGGNKELKDLIVVLRGIHQHDKIIAQNDRNTGPKTQNQPQTNFRQNRPNFSQDFRQNQNFRENANNMQQNRQYENFQQQVYAQKVCWGCGQEGHVQKACRARPANQGPAQPYQARGFGPPQQFTNQGVPYQNRIDPTVCAVCKQRGHRQMDCPVWRSRNTPSNWQNNQQNRSGQNAMQTNNAVRVLAPQGEILHIEPSPIEIVSQNVPIQNTSLQQELTPIEPRVMMTRGSPLLQSVPIPRAEILIEGKPQMVIFDSGAGPGLVAPLSRASDLLGHRYTENHIAEMITPLIDGNYITNCEGKTVQLGGQLTVHIQYKEKEAYTPLIFAVNMAHNAELIMGCTAMIMLDCKLSDHTGKDLLSTYKTAEGEVTDKQPNQISENKSVSTNQAARVEPQQLTRPEKSATGITENKSQSAQQQHQQRQSAKPHKEVERRVMLCTVMSDLTYIKSGDTKNVRLRIKDYDKVGKKVSKCFYPDASQVPDGLSIPDALVKVNPMGHFTVSVQNIGHQKAMLQKNDEIGSVERVERVSLKRLRKQYTREPHESSTEQTQDAVHLCSAVQCALN
ncbi:MAG: hypothetical protein GY820_11365 [Gammaproteobacteria bacterium]|nr:hypothetical protein [Gammaproteobacteria bacterium]